MRRLFLLLLALVAAAALAALPSSAHRSKDFPKTIALPTGFQPEGIAIAGKTFFVGSIPTGAIYSGNLRTGSGAILVPAAPGRSAIGVEFDRRGDRLFVAGGETGKAFVYDADDGDLIREYQLTTLAPTFINDVVVTRSAAWFTDSRNQQLYRIRIGKHGRLGSVRTVPLTGDISFSDGFNANGIDATRNGKTLILVQSNEGKLFRVARSGRTREIDLEGGDVIAGDGILLDGGTLFVVQNQLNRVAVVKLRRGLREGDIRRHITDPLLDVPTTIDDVGKLLYAVNARFGTPSPETASYSLIRLEKR